MQVKVIKIAFLVNSGLITYSHPAAMKENDVLKTYVSSVRSII